MLEIPSDIAGLAVGMTAHRGANTAAGHQEQGLPRQAGQQAVAASGDVRGAHAVRQLAGTYASSE